MKIGPIISNLKSISHREGVSDNDGVTIDDAIMAMLAQHAEIERLRAALKSVQDWLDTLPNAAGIPGFPKDTVDAAMLPAVVEQTAPART